MAGLLTLLIVVLLTPAQTARAGLLDGRDAMVRGRSALLAGLASEARDDFDHAESAFLRAGGQTHNPLIELVSALPILGRTTDGVDRVAQAGALAARAGRLVAAAAAALPGGVSALAPNGGRIPIRGLRAMAAPFQQASDLLGRAQDVLRTAPRSWLLGAVADGREELAAGLVEAKRTIDAAAALAESLPTFLGESGETRRYFFGAQNPAELRGTGGFIGAYSILKIKKGKFHFGPFRSIGDLPFVGPNDVEPPNPSYAKRYNRFGGAGFWLNINLTPDFPSAAVAIERLYRKVTGERLNGTMLADPFALAALLDATGEVEVPGIGAVVDADTVVPFVTNKAYALFSDNNIRKSVLGSVTAGVFGRLLQGTGSADVIDATKALGGTAAAGHILIHSVNPRVQAALALSGITGPLMDPPGDYLSVVGNNGGGNKVDYYVDRSVEYAVELGASGTASSTATVRLENHAPKVGKPQEVIGPYPGLSHRGESVTYFSAYCAQGCRFTSMNDNGIARELRPEVELGHPVISDTFHVRSKATGRIDYSWTVPDAWSAEATGGKYTLTFQGQTTIRPTQLQVAVTVPPGMRVISSTPGFSVSGRTATWTGEAPRLLQLEVRFRPV